MRCEINNKRLSIKIPFVVKWHLNQSLFFSNSSLNKFTFLAKIAVTEELDFIFYDYNPMPFFCSGKKQRDWRTSGRIQNFWKDGKVLSGKELIGFWVLKRELAERRERERLSNWKRKTGRDRKKKRKRQLLCDCTQELKSPPTTINQEFSWILDCQDFVRISLREPRKGEKLRKTPTERERERGREREGVTQEDCNKVCTFSNSILIEEQSWVEMKQNGRNCGRSFDVH